ncbi:triostin synthetase I [Biomphalaria glabrata]|uniref:Triostin synthetase I-like n=1 Tax=Biomphalaria glabrata TaxID=6526 RepID=A0A9W3B0X1_BIOGL|nr:triostin synthetase I-like [Biomphalaria glabrata]XP_055893122.1 triostin synthetase I-like [Biomphalaria glabrata]KAI8757066.1 triostin synthetase I-like [Biomphalaria glabrata]
MDTIVASMRQWADTKPEVVVFTFVNKHGVTSEYTPRAVYEKAGRFASRLRRYGFRKGDVIANGLPNSPERLVTDMGIIMAGCVMVNAQVCEVDGSDFFLTANNSNCKGVILYKKNNNAMFKLFEPLIGQNCAEYTEVFVQQAPSLTKLLLCSRVEGDLTPLLQDLGQDEIFSDAETSPSDLAVLFTTSGTSGFSKLVPRTHEQILQAGRSFEGGNVKYYSDRPFGWMGGFPFDYIVRCSHRVLQDKLTDDFAETSTDIWDVISREQCTGAAMLPIAILDLIHTYTTSKPSYKIPFIVTGGQPITRNLSPAVGLLTDALVVTYSSTECAMVSVGVVTSADQMKDNFVGKPGKDISLTIVDDSNNPVATNEQGLILLKSPFILTNYLPAVASSSIFTPDGYFITGDRGMLDESGNLFCFGRAGDVISQGPLLVYTSWPEKVLSKCPDVADVVVLVMSVTDNAAGFYACVVPKPGSTVTKESLMDFYTSSFMTSTTSEKFKPELADIFLFERFPQTFTGKVNKPRLKDLVLQQLCVNSTAIA